jgi:hypothetical protein
MLFIFFSISLKKPFKLDIVMHLAYSNNKHFAYYIIKNISMNIITIKVFFIIILQLYKKLK